ncbi:MAG: thiamine diphosphokinase [Anaerolineales bacterium]|nr:thiamine diphosphokinase [Anaerolineales bacterium]
MTRAVIFANGVLSPTSRLPFQRQDGDLLIAADGGTRHCLAFDLIPHVVIGDFDSLETSMLAYLQAQGTLLIRHPGHKDETDLELTFRYALQAGVNEIIVLGALGERWDMTLANLLLAAGEEYSCVRVRFLDGNQEITILHSGETLVLHGQPGDTVSLIPLRGDGQAITTRGLEYPLAQETLAFGSPRGVSNVLLGEQAEIYLAAGTLLCTIQRNNRLGGQDA